MQPSLTSSSPDVILTSSTKTNTQMQTENFGNSAIRKRHSLTPKQTTPHRQLPSKKASVRRTSDTSAMKNGTIEEPILIESKEATPQQELRTSQKKKHIKVFTIEDTPENKKQGPRTQDQKEDKVIQCDLFDEGLEKKNDSDRIEEERVEDPSKENMDDIIVKKNLSKNVDIQEEIIEQGKTTLPEENSSNNGQGPSTSELQNNFFSKIIPEDEPNASIEKMPENPSQSNNNSQTGSVMQEERIKTPLVIPKMKNESDKEQILVKVSVSKEFPNNSNQTENQDPFQGYLSKSQENSKGAQSDKNINIMENYIPSEPVQYDSNLLYGFRAPTSPCNPSSSPIKQPQQLNFFNSKDTSRFGESPASRRESIGDRSGSKLFLSYEKHSNFGNGIRNETGSRLEENAVFPVEMSFNEENEDLFEKETGVGKNESIGKNQSILDSELKRSLQLESENNRQMSSTKANQDQENSLRSQEQSQKNQSVTKSVAKEDFPETGRQSLSKINEQHQTNHFEQSEAEPSQIRHIPIFTPSKLEKADQETKITIYFNPFENRRSSVNKDTLNPSQSNRVSLDKLENPFTSKEKNTMVVENENIYHSEFDANEDVENDKPTFGTTSPWENKQENKSPLKENTFLLNSAKSQRGGNEDNSAMQIEDPHGNDSRITTEANPMPLRHAKSPNYLEKKLQKIQEENMKSIEASDFAQLMPDNKASVDKQKPQLSKLINENFHRMEACSAFLEEMKPKRSPKAETTIIKPKEGSYSAIHGVFAKSPSKRPSYALPSLSACASPIRYDDPKDGKKTAGPTFNRDTPTTPTHTNSSNKRKWDAFQASNNEEQDYTSHEEKKFKQNSFGHGNFDKIVIGNLKRGQDQASGKQQKDLERKKISGNKGEMLVEHNILMSKENIPFESNRQITSQKKDKTGSNVMKTSGTKLAKCCAFCGVALEKGQTKLLSCLHRSHIECFTAWERKKKISCPICNSNSSPISISNFTVSGTKTTPGSKF